MTTDAASTTLAPVLAMLYASCTMAGSNLAMRWVLHRGGRALRVQLLLFAGALVPLLAMLALQPHAMSPSAMAIGAIAGGSALLAGVCSLNAMRYGKVGPTVLVLMMAAAVPVILSAWMRWDRGLTQGKAAGLAMATIAVVLCTWPRREAGSAAPSWRRWCLWAFAGWALNSINQSCQKIQSVVHAGGEAFTFNLFYFVSGLAIGLAVERLPRMRGAADTGARKAERNVGLGFGLLIAAQMFAILYAVSRLNAAIAFPTLAVLPLVLVTAGAGVAFRERLAGAERLGVLLACAGLILLNM